MIGLWPKAHGWIKVLGWNMRLWFANGPEDAHEEP